MTSNQPDHHTDYPYDCGEMTPAQIKKQRSIIIESNEFASDMADALRDELTEYNFAVLSYYQELKDYVALGCYYDEITSPIRDKVISRIAERWNDAGEPFGKEY